MNISQFKRPLKKLFPIFTLAILLTLQSCGTTKHEFSTSSVVPAAVGSVKVKKDKNKNYSIKLKVERLASPKRLSPSKNTYVVWMVTDQDGQKNIGQLKTSSGWFSSALKSSLETVSSSRPKSFFITAEDNANVQYPEGQTVLTTR